MSNTNCNTVKEEYYECLKIQNLGFDPNLLKFNAAASLNKLNEIRIDGETYKKCNGQLFSKCLSLKYEIKNINEKELAKYYNEQYDEKMKKKNEETIKSNTLNKIK